MIVKFRARKDVRCEFHSMSLLFGEQLLGIHNRNSLDIHLGLKSTLETFLGLFIRTITIEWRHEVSHSISILIFSSDNRFSWAKRTHTHAINESITLTTFALAIWWVANCCVITVNASTQIVGTRSVGVTEIAFVTNTFSIICALNINLFLGRQM